MNVIRIGNAQAFWGDRSDAAAELLALEPDLDYLTLDYLAEVSMSILALQRERDPAAGFARDFVDVVRSLAHYWMAGGRCRLIANAGGLNPRGCAEACREALEEAGCRAMKIGVVTGDNVLEEVRTPGEWGSSQFQNLDSGEPIDEIRDRLVTANAYLGAMPILEALERDAEIVITGRVADPSLTLAPCLWQFGWSSDDLDRLAGATVAGHLIECGTQVTGGISTDWLDVPDVTHIGFPIVEIAEDGSCVVTKARGTGGRVSAMTVKEQLLYEIGDPDNYLSPDVGVSFLSLNVEDLGDNRVKVSGAKEKPRPEMYKVSATYRDGYRAAGTLTMMGRNGVAKARRCGEAILQRVRKAGFELRDAVIECLGSGDASSGIVPQANARSTDFCEVVFRVAVETGGRDAAEYFASELMPFITAGPQGTTGYAEGRPRVHPVFRYWPCLIERAAVAPQVEVISSKNVGKATAAQSRNESRVAVEKALAASGACGTEPPASLPSSVDRGKCLYDIACARSGDKGTSANLGVIARNNESWTFLRSWLTAERVAEYFAPAGAESVERFELPNLGALNFVIHGVLRRSLRIDAQGKALGQLLLEMPLPNDDIKR
jgi:hypothetical protein